VTGGVDQPHLIARLHFRNHRLVLVARGSEHDGHGPRETVRKAIRRKDRFQGRLVSETLERAVCANPDLLGVIDLINMRSNPEEVTSLTLASSAFAFGRQPTDQATAVSFRNHGSTAAAELRTY